MTFILRFKYLPPPYYLIKFSSKSKSDNHHGALSVPFIYLSELRHSSDENACVCFFSQSMFTLKRVFT